MTKKDARPKEDSNVNVSIPPSCVPTAANVGSQWYVRNCNVGYKEKS